MAKKNIEDVDLYAILDVQISATESEVWVSICFVYVSVYLFFM